MEITRENLEKLYKKELIDLIMKNENNRKNAWGKFYKEQGEHREHKAYQELLKKRGFLGL